MAVSWGPQRRASGLEGSTVSPSSHCLELHLKEREPNEKALAEERCVSESMPQSHGVRGGLELKGDTQ